MVVVDVVVLVIAEVATNKGKVKFHCGLITERKRSKLASEQLQAKHSGLVGGGLGILGSNFVFVLFASWDLLTCIGVGKNASDHLKRAIRVPNPSLF